jgi:hypothetical protein
VRATDGNGLTRRALLGRLALCLALAPALRLGSLLSRLGRRRDPIDDIWIGHC